MAVVLTASTRSFPSDTPPSTKAIDCARKLMTTTHTSCAIYRPITWLHDDTRSRHCYARVSVCLSVCVYVWVSGNGHPPPGYPPRIFRVSPSHFEHADIHLHTAAVNLVHLMKQFPNKLNWPVLSWFRLSVVILRWFNFCLLNLSIYVVLGCHIRWWNKAVYNVSWICRERTAKTVNCCDYSYFV